MPQRVPTNAERKKNMLTWKNKTFEMETLHFKSRNSLEPLAHSSHN